MAGLDMIRTPDQRVRVFVSPRWASWPREFRIAE